MSINIFVVTVCFLSSPKHFFLDWVSKKKCLDRSSLLRPRRYFFWSNIYWKMAKLEIPDSYTHFDHCGLDKKPSQDKCLFHFLYVYFCGGFLGSLPPGRYLITAIFTLLLLLLLLCIAHWVRAGRCAHGLPLKWVITTTLPACSTYKKSIV